MTQHQKILSDELARVTSVRKESRDLRWQPIMALHLASPFLAHEMLRAQEFNVCPICCYGITTDGVDMVDFFGRQAFIRGPENDVVLEELDQL